MSMAKEQAERHNSGKPQLSYILDAPHALAAEVSVMEFGATKYARGNWKKGMPQGAVVDSLLRHLTSYMNGELLDPESGLPHVGHIMCNARFLAEFELRGDYAATCAPAPESKGCSSCASPSAACDSCIDLSNYTPNYQAEIAEASCATCTDNGNNTYCQTCIDLSNYKRS